MQFGMYIDQSRCTGCYACVVACKDWHDIPAGPASRIRLKTVEKGGFPDIFVSFLPITCYHCQAPDCESVCPTGAITKRDEDGIVTVNREICDGHDECGLCLEACMYEAPQFEAEQDAKMHKCDLCIDRWAVGKKPACVSSCPLDAMDAGPMDELIEKYGDIRDAEGFIDSDTMKPSITYKPRKDNKNLDILRVEIMPRPRSADPEKGEKNND